MNLAIRSSLKTKGYPAPPDLTKETIKVLNEIHSDFEKGPENISETIVKTQGDRWIVARKIDSRELYVIFDNKLTNILEINEEIKNLTSKYFTNLFIE
eukprot:gene8290-10186_t